MSDMRINTTEDLTAYRAAMRRRSDPVGCTACIFIAIGTVLAYVLPYSIPASRIPAFFRLTWNTLPLLIIFLFVALALTSVLFRLIGHGKYAAADQAINSYDVARHSYQRWEERSDAESLLRSHEALMRCEPVLSDLPEFILFRDRVRLQYERYFRVQAR
jgi:branched-subunit amino acid transport protein AzlD